jgi:hypothetical protein
MKRAPPNYRRHSTYEPAQPAELPPWALFAPKMPQISGKRATGLICVGSALFIASNAISLGAKKLPIILSMYISRGLEMYIREWTHPASIRSGLPGLFCEVVESDRHGCGQRRDQIAAAGLSGRPSNLLSGLESV